LSLFPRDDILTKEIGSWSGFVDSLHTEEGRNLFKKMLNECYKYSVAVNAKDLKFYIHENWSIIKTNIGNNQILLLFLYQLYL
jgi:hypothetical protein